MSDMYNQAAPSFMDGFSYQASRAEELERVSTVQLIHKSVFVTYILQFLKKVFLSCDEGINFPLCFFTQTYYVEDSGKKCKKRFSEGCTF